jgi:hypothetical protein
MHEFIHSNDATMTKGTPTLRTLARRVLAEGAGNELRRLDYVKALEQEVQDWHECASYDALMSGPKFKGWNRSALDRCRQRYIEK